VSRTFTVAVDHRDRNLHAAMRLKSTGSWEIFRLQQIRCSSLPKSLIRYENSLIRCVGNFARNRLILQIFPTLLRAKFPANCKNSLQIPAYQGIWIAETGSTVTACATTAKIVI
jgi:hypothetical protein